MDALKERGVLLAEVTLYVGYGTFSPVRAEDIREHVMHAEYAEVPEETARAIAEAKAQGRPVVAVGTTTTRTLESMASTLGCVGPFRGWTDIFIRPGYTFKVVDQLITNFHLPRSSLIIMVSTLAGRRQILDAYNHAVRQGFRFFSYGDAMLIR
jgi:S-adenosylmethionine:tRNA ribosyltransferase-isomerase